MQSGPGSEPEPRLFPASPRAVDRGGIAMGEGLTGSASAASLSTDRCEVRTK